MAEKGDALKCADVARKRPSSVDDNASRLAAGSNVVSQHPGKRRRHVRHHSSSSDSALMDVSKISKAMDKLLLHPGKLHVFQAYFDDPEVKFSVRPDGRRRHPAGSGRQILVEGPVAYIRERQAVPVLNQAGAVVGYNAQDTGEPLPGPSFDPEHSIHSAKTAPISQVYEGDFSVRTSSCSSRGLSAASSASFHSGADPNPEPELVPFAGLDSPPEDVSQPVLRIKADSSAGCSTADSKGRPLSETNVRISMSSVELDAYMASRSSTDSEEEPEQPMPDIDADDVAVLLDKVVIGDGSLPSPEPMSVSSEPSTSSEVPSHSLDLVKPEH